MRVLWTLTGVACTPSSGPPADPTPGIEGHDEVTIERYGPCESSGYGIMGLEERASARGLLQIAPRDVTPRSCPYVPGGIVASDLDGDGDVDLAFAQPDGFPALYEFEGAVFSPVVTADPGGLPSGRQPLAVAAADLDGDGLPELLVPGEGFLVSFPNLGGLLFGPAEIIHFQPEYPITCHQSLTLADFDGDGDLDLVLPGLDSIPEAGWIPPGTVPGDGSWGYVYLHQENSWEAVLAVGPGDRRWLSMLALPTDRDDDGDLDLLLASDRARDGRPGAAFYRNDGPGPDGVPLLIDDAPALAADLHSDTMGAASWDWNADGLPDYCLSDLLPDLRCLLSSPGGPYVEAGLALGLTAHIDEHPELGPEDVGQWSPWSLELIDLDNDGWPEMAAAAGQPPGAGGVWNTFRTTIQPDALWQGGPDGYTDVSWETGFARAEAHYGMVSVDLDHDGAREIILAGWDAPALLWENPCSDTAWIEVDLQGPVGNSQGFGARVELFAGVQRSAQEVQSLRTVGQSPPTLHWGLGQADRIEFIRVRWPDGATSEILDLPVRARLIIRHPSRIEAM